MTLRAFQCFAAGTHTDMHGRTFSFSDLQLKQIAAAYDPNREPAPLVLGHPRDDKNAREHHGEVRALVAENGALFAIADIWKSLVDLVREHKYKHVSASFNQDGGDYSLRHIGFLGSTPPAVKGMQPLAFAVQLEDVAGLVERAIDTANFAAYGCDPESPRAQLYRVAKDLHRARPELGFTGAAIIAERALTRR